MFDLFVRALRAVRALRSIPLAHACHHGNTFAETSRRSRLALAAIAERTISNAGSVALQTPRIEMALRDDGDGRRPKRGGMRFLRDDKGQTCHKERRGDSAK
jgi:hypothetical protein